MTLSGSLLRVMQLGQSSQSPLKRVESLASVSSRGYYITALKRARLQLEFALHL